MQVEDLLGPLEAEVMELMWQKGSATVREMLDALQSRRSFAYTTVMTIMNNLATKGLLWRAPEGKAYRYAVAMTREAFLRQKSEQAVSDVLSRFGDLAIARFIEKVSQLRPEDMERLRQLAQDTSGKEEK